MTATSVAIPDREATSEPGLETKSRGLRMIRGATVTWGVLSAIVVGAGRASRI